MYNVLLLNYSSKDVAPYFEHGLVIGYSIKLGPTEKCRDIQNGLLFEKL
jgi:hypothetical protein